MPSPTPDPGHIHPPTIINMIDKEKGDGSDTSDRQSRLYERPNGLRGLYANPITQARSLPFVFPSSIYSFKRWHYLVLFVSCARVRSWHSQDDWWKLSTVTLGLFNALNGLGAGGQVDSTTSANANAALYATFAFFAFFAGQVPGLVIVSQAKSFGFFFR